MRMTPTVSDSDAPVGADVISLDEHRPHVTLLVQHTDGQAVHVIPVFVVRRWAEGSLPLPEPDLIRAFIGRWLDHIESGGFSDDGPIGA